MSLNEPKKPEPSPEADDPSGFLIRKCGEGDGFKIGTDVEVRVNKIIGNKAYVAIKAPKTTKIEQSDR